MRDPQSKIVLGMPNYGSSQTAASAIAFWHLPCAEMRGVENVFRAGSLLAANFNRLWCHALNLVHRGERVDYFAMLHGDIGPERFWLDKLIDELEENELDVLGVVVPIKDRRGMTSLALSREDTPWRVHAKLSMHDVYSLPETFTSEDCGRPLLLNTGCWVVKWNQEWCNKVHFEIRDRIVFRTDLDCYENETIPEDWGFSRQLHSIGEPGGETEGLRPLRIGATRKIGLEHTGEMKFVNDHAWGTDHFDTELLTRSPIEAAFPYDILGWLLPEEGAKLAELAAGKRVLEIGSMCGLSTVCMARTAEHVTAVDYFDGRGTSIKAEGGFRKLFDESLMRHNVTHKVAVCHPEYDALPFDQYDLVFVDGAHDVDSVRADIERAMSVVTPDGLIAFHDYKIGIDGGVDLADNEFIASGAVLVSQTKSLAVVKPPALIPQEA